jgi:hypothetical protein
MMTGLCKLCSICAVTATAGEAPDEAAPAGEAVFDAPAVLRIIWADPQHMPEHIAIWSLSRFGPRARAAVGKLRSQYPDAGRGELERLVIGRQARAAMTEGAFVGGPFIVLIPVAFCAALLAQAQMVFELAAVAGREPNDHMRVADVLVLLGAYGSTEEANRGLAAVTRDPEQHQGKKLPAGTRWDMVKRMAYLLEVLGPAEENRGRLRAALGWVGLGALFLVGVVLPLVWVPYMGYVSRRSAVRLGERARAYYMAGQAGETGVTVRRRQVVRAGGTAALARTVLLVVVPVVVALVALLTDFSFGSGRWVSAGITLLAVSAVATAGWLGYRWWRHRRAAKRSRSQAAAPTGSATQAASPPERSSPG